MKSISSRRARTIAVAIAAGSLALTACSSGGKAKEDDRIGGVNKAAEQGEPIPLGKAADSTGPAPKAKDAKDGGFIRVYQQDSYDHLDPAQIYVSDEGQLATLYARQLTNYKIDSKGRATLVGDLATDSGTMSDGGRTWKYTLKDGIKDQDGDPITSADVRHTIERTYAKFISDGPTYIQQWLSGTGTAYRKALPDGPYTGKHLPDSVLETPDAKTVIFHFTSPKPDAPFALAMAGYGIVPQKKDTKEKYDSKPVALGPYKIADYKPGKSMKMVRNTNWNPKTDSKRAQYVDGFNITFNHSPSDTTKRLLNDNGEAKSAVSWVNAVDSLQTRDVLNDPSASKRLVSGWQPYVWQMNFNMFRIKDKRVRDAITYALPSLQLVKLDGGTYGGEVAGGLLAPTLPGYDKSFDPYDKLKKPNGDPARAKKLLQQAGKVGMKLTYAYSNTEIRQQQSVAVVNSLKEAGFDVQKKELDNASWYTRVGKINNPYDIYMTGWGQDWGSASTVIPPSFDGTQIQDGATNYSHLNDKHVNSEIARILKITDQDEAKAQWVKLHQYIVEKINPAAPMYYTKQMQLYGSNIGGAQYNNIISYIDPLKMYLKK